MAQCLERLQQMLHEQGIRFETRHHREVFTMQAVAAELHEKGDHVAKIVIAWVDGRLVMLVLPAPEQVDFDRVAHLLNAQYARAAREDEFKFRFPDCEAGAMPPFGHLYQMPTYIDTALTQAQTIVFQAGTHRDTITMAMDDYLRVAAPTTADFILQRHPTAAN